MGYPYFWKHPHLPSIFHTRPWTPPLCFARAECSATKRETLCGIEAECRTLKPGPRMDHEAMHYRGNPVRFFLSSFFFVDLLWRWKKILSAIFQCQNHRWPTSTFLTCRVTLGDHRDSSPSESAWNELRMGSATRQCLLRKTWPQTLPKTSCRALYTLVLGTGSNQFTLAHHYSTFPNHNTHHFIQNVQKLLAAPPFSKKQKMGSGQCPNLLFGSRLCGNLPD